MFCIILIRVKQLNFRFPIFLMKKKNIHLMKKCYDSKDSAQNVQKMAFSRFRLNFVKL